MTRDELLAAAKKDEREYAAEVAPIQRLIAANTASRDDMLAEIVALGSAIAADQARIAEIAAGFEDRKRRREWPEGHPHDKPLTVKTDPPAEWRTPGKPVATQVTKAPSDWQDSGARNRDEPK